MYSVVIITSSRRW